MRRHSTGSEWTILGLLMALLAMLLWLSGCGFAIPVRAVPSDEPILVAPVGEAGGVTMNAKLPQPDPAKFPSAGSVSGGWGMLWQIGLGLLVGGGGVGVVAGRANGMLKTALTIAHGLADNCADAETDEEVAKAREEAAKAHEAAGVTKLVQKITGNG